MSDNFQSINKFASNQIDAISAIAGVFARSAEKIFAETRDYSAETCRNQSALVSKLISAKSLTEAITASSEHAKAHYDASVGESRKLREIFTDLAADTVKTVLKTAPAEAPAKPKPAQELLSAPVLDKPAPGAQSFVAPQPVKAHPRVERGAA